MDLLGWWAALSVSPAYNYGATGQWSWSNHDGIGGPKNIVPGMIFWSVTGGLGQLAANVVSWRPSSEPGRSFLQSKWSPVTYLSDHEYEKILEGRLLRIEAEIAIVDENIKELRDAEKRVEQQSTPRSPKAQ